MYNKNEHSFLVNHDEIIPGIIIEFDYLSNKNNVIASKNK